METSLPKKLQCLVSNLVTLKRFGQPPDFVLQVIRWRLPHTLKIIIFGIAMTVYASETLLASVITRSFNFTASEFFAPLGTATPPQDPVFGRFKVSYDTMTDTIGGTLDDIDLTIAGFSYSTASTGFNYDSAFDNLLVGGLLNGIEKTSGMTDDFVLSFRATLPSPTYFASFLYVTSTTPIDTPGFLADTRIPPSNVVISEVPEPSTFVLLSLGLAGISYIRSRDKKTGITSVFTGWRGTIGGMRDRLRRTRFRGHPLRGHNAPGGVRWESAR